MNNFKTSAIAALLIAGFSGQASAHAAWIAESNSDLTIVYGDLSNDGYETKYIETINAKTASMGDCAVTRQDHDDHVTFEICEGGIYASTAYMRGYSTKDKDGKRFSLPKNEVPNAAKSGFYVKYATSILGEIGGEPQLQGNKLEILPLTDPTQVEAGSTLTVRVYFEGKPLAGAKFYRDYATDHMNIFTSNADGEVTFQVRNNGLNVLAAKHNVLTPDAETQDKFGYYSTLSFVSSEGK